VQKEEYEENDSKEDVRGLEELVESIPRRM
jgi:hypothetical protein